MNEIQRATWNVHAIKRSENTNKSEIQKRDIGKLNKKEEFIEEVTANVQNTQLQRVEDINEILNKIKKGITKAAVKIIRKEERPQRNIWKDVSIRR
jgi:hypothetical protein